MTETVTCGEATMRLLARYGVTTVFGIPGVHTLDFCRGLGGAIQHVQARNEMGAGFMAEGWARATGTPGVALVISGPGVTNAATPVAQAYADSLPLLMLSAEPPSTSIGKGWGVLHEVTEQKKVTEPLTALSATAMRSDDVPELLAQAFTLFASARPRPVHLSIPIDVQAELVHDTWQPVTPPVRPQAPQAMLDAAARMLREAERPLIMVGGGACEASEALQSIAETLGAPVLASTAGKGIVPDDHPLSLSGATVRAEGLACLATADVVLAIGTELSETDSFVDRLPIDGRLIRIDIDARKLTDLYPAELGIVGDAAPAARGIRDALTGHRSNRSGTAEREVADVRKAIGGALTPSEQRHSRLLALMDDTAPRDIIWAGDACQLVYTGAFKLPMRRPRQWFYPAGYCALGNALPNAIGAKMALPESPVAVLVGDGGFMFTMPELLTAAGLKLPLAIVIWENDGLKQIQDDMDSRNITRVGVEGINPDFIALARACHCHAVRATSADAFSDAFKTALNADRPTVIVVREDAAWLQ